MWQLSVTVNKCNILHIGFVQRSIDYFIDGVELPNSTRCRDLGVSLPVTYLLECISVKLLPSHIIVQTASYGVLSLKMLAC